MVVQTKLPTTILDNVKTTFTSDYYQRGPVYPVKVVARLNGGRAGQSATVIINGGDTTSPSIPLATITLTEAESEENFIVYAPYTYLNAVVSAFDATKPGAVLVIFDAVEE